MRTERYRPKHLNSSEYGFLASVGSDRGKKLAAHADSIDDHAVRAEAVDMKPRTSEAEDYVNDDDDASSIDDARRAVESKSRAVERSARSHQLKSSREKIAKDLARERRRRAG